MSTPRTASAFVLPGAGHSAWPRSRTAERPHRKASTVNTEALTVRPLTGRAELDLFRRLSYALDAELDVHRVGRRRPHTGVHPVRAARLA